MLGIAEDIVKTRTEAGGTRRPRCRVGFRGYALLSRGDVDGQRPDEPFGDRPVLRHFPPKEKLLPCWREEGRLSLVGAARLDVVVRSNQDVERLFVIPIEISENEVERPVGIPLPALEDRHD